MQPISGAGVEDYYNTTTLNYEAEWCKVHTQTLLRVVKKMSEME